MASYSRCGNCSGTAFHVAEKAHTISGHALRFVECVACNEALGIVEFDFNKEILAKQHAMLTKLDERLTAIEYGMNVVLGQLRR